MLMTKDGITREVEQYEVQKFKEMGFVEHDNTPEPQPRQDKVEIVSEKIVSKKKRANRK